MASRPRPRSGPRKRRPPAPVPLALPPPPAIVRSDGGLWCYERALRRVGFQHVAGVDEAGRGACAGPLVVAAVVLPEGRRGEIPGLADSKLLTAEQRESAYAQVIARATAWSACVIPTAEVDRRGVHQANVAGMRRAVAGLSVLPGYTLTDGFPIPGMPSPSCAVWKGDQVIGCVAAASVVAKVTRDRMMRELDTRFPQYAFASHKGYCTPEHDAMLQAHGPCDEHRYSFVNVRNAAATKGLPTRVRNGVPLVGQDVDMPEFASADLPQDLEGVA
ncbi:MAG TPA: ribonuclease HII [Frankiaceae bacterium]|nr:ribonuclease HII [Frankiaceae bacterium]